MPPKIFSPYTLQNRPHIVDSIQKLIERTDPRGIAAAARGMAQRPDFTAELQNISCPTLVVVGQDDAVSPVAEMQGIAQAIPGARFTVIPNAGHMSPLEQPDMVNAAIESFLTGFSD
jgi:3-oxoadipate enol-lactonase